MATDPAAIRKEWVEENLRILPELEALQRNPAIVAARRLPLRVLKVSQLDAQTLDDELFDILKQQFISIFSHFSTLAQKYEPELLLGLDIFLFRLSIWNLGATYGQQLQNLVTKVEGTGKRSLILTLYMILKIVLPYGFRRWTQRAQGWVALPPDDPKKQWWVITSKIEAAFSLLSFVNFVAFLYQGAYPTLAHRLCGLRLVQASLAQRSVSFDFMNRQLLWNGIAEFMIFLAPLFPGSGAYIYNVFSAFVKRALRVPLSLLPTLFGSSDTTEPEGVSSHNQACPVCDERSILTPWGMVASSLSSSAQCCHRFCYYCLSQRLAEKGGLFHCPLDGAPLTSTNTGRITSL